MANLTDEGQRTMFARSLRTFDAALCDVGGDVANSPCSPENLASARDKFDAARGWLHEYLQQATRLGGTLNETDWNFFDVYVIAALGEVERCMIARPDDSAEAIAASIGDARSKLLWFLHELR